MEQRPKKLLGRVREAIRLKRYSGRTGGPYAAWIGRYILFHTMNGIREKRRAEVEAFLTHLAVD